MDKVIIASVEDRLTVAAILVKNDYTVRRRPNRQRTPEILDRLWSCDSPNPGEHGSVRKPRKDRVQNPIRGSVC